jgi:hypothetical protein
VYKIRKFSLFSFLQPFLTSSFVGSNILLNTLSSLYSTLSIICYLPFNLTFSLSLVFYYFVHTLLPYIRCFFPSFPCTVLFAVTSVLYFLLSPGTELHTSTNNSLPCRLSLSVSQVFTKFNAVIWARGAPIFCSECSCYSLVNVISTFLKFIKFKLSVGN